MGTIKDSVKNMAEATGALITAAGYSIVDSIEEWKIEQEEEREEREEQARKEAARKKARMEECRQLLLESGIRNVAEVYWAKEKEHTQRQKEFEEMERVAAESVPEIDKKQKNNKAINIMAGAVVITGGAGLFFESPVLVLCAVICFIFGLIYDFTVGAKIQEAAITAMPEELRERHTQLLASEAELNALKKLYDIQKEYEELYQELRKKEEET